MAAADRNVEKMEAQIKDWGTKIETLVIKAETVWARASFALSTGRSLGPPPARADATRL